jgi:broad specificity phosphatase PhoE
MSENPQSAIHTPQLLWLVRHGESTANVARYKAEAENLLTIDFPETEAEVPLSDFGAMQAAHSGKWFAEQADKPTVVYSSPYVRTRETARIILETAGLGDLKIRFDDRLRERELGIFDRLTWRGSMEKYPAETAERLHIGKFNYRPANGESWADLATRVNEFWQETKGACAGENVLIVTHEAVIRLFSLCFGGNDRRADFNHRPRGCHRKLRGYEIQI